mgnify:CR=1 FL=1
MKFIIHFKTGFSWVYLHFFVLYSNEFWIFLIISKKVIFISGKVTFQVGYCIF